MFYGLGSWTQTVILALDVIVNYILSRLFSGKIKNNRIKQFWFWFTIIGNIALLVYFKWVRYIPIGISFYTFMILSYQIDVYRRDVPCEKSILRLGTYFFFFPKL
ncbi:MAG: MBOAT family protein, partial [Bacillota bacterium]|nr:MBOAT family protein [Bacillota bacterium]